MALREKHGLSTQVIEDQNNWVNSNGFDPTHVRLCDQLKTRRNQLLPLLPLYISTVPVEKSYKKKAKQKGYLTPLENFELPWFCPVDISIRELTIPGVLEHLEQNCHGMVRPIAKAFMDGKVVRENPAFTFDGIQGAEKYFLLGSDVKIRTSEHRTRLVKIVSIFIHTGQDPVHCAADEPSRAIYVQFYSPLSDYKASSKDSEPFVRSAMRNNGGPKEMVLNSKEILMKGAALDQILETIQVVHTPEELVLEPGSYLCRFAVDSEVCYYSSISNQCVFSYEV
jgi:hypothetical protein